MEQRSISVLLIEDNPDFARLVQHWLAAGAGDVAFSMSWADSLSGGLGQISRGAVEVVVLDLGLPDSDGLGTFTAVHKQAKARGIPVIILSGADTESLALQTIQEGAENYLVKSACNAAVLSQALRFAVAKHTAEVASRTRVIGVIGAKGGVGATTIACNLATELRTQTGKRVLLADLDLHAGLVAFMMGVDPQYSFQYAIANFQRLDESCWNAIISRNRDDLHIVSSPALLGREEVPVETIRQVLALVQPFYDWMVLDLGRLNALSAALVNRTNEIFVVTSTGLGALYEAKRAVEALAKAGLGKEQIRLIVNEADRAPALSQRDMRSIFGTEVYASVPHEAAQMQQAMLARRPPPETCGLRKQMALVARKLAGLPEKNSRGSLSQLFSLPHRWRKSPGPDPAATSG